VFLALPFLAGCAHHAGSETGHGGRAGGGLLADPVVSASVGKGVAALLLRQHADDGSWGGDDVKVQSSHKSDYPVAISSLAYLALTTVAPGDPGADRAREKSLRFVLDTIDDVGNMLDTRDHTPKVHERNLWSQGFSLFVLGHILRADAVVGAEPEEIRAKMASMVSALAKTQRKDGGWTYNKGAGEGFTTATILFGLFSARDAGVSVPETLVRRSTEFLRRVSNPGFYVAYKGIPRALDTSGEVRDSSGRSVQVELALLQAGRGSREKLGIAVDSFFKHRDRLDRVRDLEEGCHQPPHKIGTFYCFFDYFYVAQALENLAPAARDRYRTVFREHFLALQKADGHWIDSRDHCGESYGTAMGLLILSAPAWCDPVE
jgi:hypothetical protein